VKKVITTVGTSLITNYQREKNGGTLVGAFKCIDREVEKFEPLDSSKYDSAENVNDIATIKEVIQSKWVQGVRWHEERDAWVVDSKATGNTKASAELSTLYKIKGEYEFDTVYFICTDTALSVLAAECMKDYSPLLQGIDVHIIRVPHLKVKDFDEFKKNGLSNLVKEIVSIIDEESAENLLMNISGGYKAFIPFLTVLTQIYKIPAFYIYEESDQLIQFPQLPINFDWEFAQAFARLLEKDADGVLVFDYKKDIDEKVLGAYIDYGLLKEDGRIFILTEVGLIYGMFASEFCATQKRTRKKVRFEHDQTLNGHFAEYKWMEYYYNTLLPLRIYHSVKNRKEICLNNNIHVVGAHEIDLIVERVNDFIVCESKSFGQIRNTDAGVEEMTVFLMNRVVFNPMPSEFHLCVYAIVSGSKEKTEVMTELADFKNKLFNRNKLKNTNINFKLLVMFPPVLLEDFMQNPLSNKDVIQLI